MTVQVYLQVENNVVNNSVMWDGDTNTWQPPADATMLVQETTPAMVWEYQSSTKTYVLTEVVGAGQIGFTWDGLVLTTNEPQPIIKTQPTTVGTTAA
jgi:hypothetical protein